MNVSVVITCWNGKKLLEKNLPKVLKASKNPNNKIFEIIVADDCSTDDSVSYLKNSYLKKEFQEVKVIEQSRNLGYAANCNSAVKVTKGDLIVILNLDVIPKDDFLESSLPLFKDDKVFAVSFNEGKFGPGKLLWKNGFLEIVGNNQLPESTILTDWPSGGSSIFRKSIWQELGGFDLLFSPFYFEDVDLGLRGKKIGYKCLWNFQAMVKHEHEATINSKSFNQNYLDLIKQRNHLLLTWKNLDNTGLFFSHVCGLGKRIMRHPGYLKILFLATIRLMSCNIRKKKVEEN